jgi:hypothetical protein
MTKDLAPPRLDDLAWDDASREESLEKVRRQLVEDARVAADWYAGGRRRKKQFGLLSRFLAIVLVAVAGLFPIFVSIPVTTDPPADTLSPLWASLAVGLAALLVGLDRFMGWSSGWIRYITAELAIRGVLRDFEIDWQVRRAAWHGNAPTAEQVAELLAVGREFALRVHTLVAEETAAWATEFQANLRQLDDAVRAAEVEQRTARESAKPGALNLVVSNAAEMAQGWYLSVNGGPARVYMGPRASIARLVPGLHHLRVSGVVGGVERVSELTAEVPPGAVTTAEIAL